MDAMLGLRRLLPAAMLLWLGTMPTAGAQERGILSTQHVREEVHGAQPVGRLPPDRVLHFDMMLALGAPEKLDQFLAELYDPASPLDRHFVTPAEFTDRFGPSQAAWDELVRFAGLHGFTIVGGSRDEMDLRLAGSVHAIESAFQVKMRVFKHPREARTYYSPDTEPTVDMRSVVWHISGLDNFAVPQPRVHARSAFTARPLATSGACPGNSYCGSDMRAAYYGGTALTGSGQSVGLVEFSGYENADLADYFGSSGQTNPVPLNAISTDGSPTGCVYTNGCVDTEQTLDITQVIGMAPGLAQLNIYIGASDTAILSAMSVVPPGSITGKVDAQLSCSWGWGPADPATDDPLFKKFAAQGQSFFTAAGDNAAYSAASQFVFPADDVNVTVVGGTDLSTTGAGGAWLGETAWSDGGGGFYAADNMKLPAWQTAAIAAFDSRSSKSGSTLWRNSPDVSGEANFDFYVCADQQGCTANAYGGTSFATPMWAGYLALVNEQAALEGQPPMGFLNPALYALGNASGNAYAAAFHDISSGSNGYPAQPGYDLATGWGSPNGAGLIAALLGTGAAAVAPSFSLSGSTADLSLTAGSKGALTLSTATSGGFNGPIALSVSGQPAGVTATFSRASIAASGTATLTLSLAPTVAAGAYPLVLTGVGGSVTKTLAVTLQVAAIRSPVFALSVPAAISIVHGKSRAYTVETVTTGSTRLSIALSVSGMPAGVSATFRPAMINGTGGSIIALTVAPSAKPVTTTVTISGTAGTVTQTSRVSLTVN